MHWAVARFVDTPIWEIETMPDMKQTCFSATNEPAGRAKPDRSDGCHPRRSGVLVERSRTHGLARSSGYGAEECLKVESLPAKATATSYTIGFGPRIDRPRKVI